MKAVARTCLTTVALALPILITGCGGNGDPDLPPTASATSTFLEGAAIRSFEMGFGYLPAERTASGYEQAFRSAGEHGELILIQRGPPWESFLPGHTLDNTVVESTRADTLLAEQYALDFFVAIDPTDPTDRGRLFNPPPELEGLTFADQEVRDAYLAYVRYMAENYRPRYMALAVEVNVINDQDPANYLALVDTYAEAYEMVKDVVPEAEVFVTIQYEAMQALLPGNPETNWDVLDDFEPLDLVGLSTYPSFAFGSAAEVPADYYDQILLHTNQPVAIAEMGFSSEPVGENLSSGTDEDQLRYLEKALLDAQRLGFVFAVWYLSADPTFDLPAPFNSLSRIGLVRSDGSEKPAWEAWIEFAARPIQPEGVQEAETPAPIETTPEPGTSASTPTPTS
jgi:hypothetical protein